MRSRPSSNTQPRGDFLKVELEFLVDPEHPLVRLAGQIDWAFIERLLAESIAPIWEPPASRLEPVGIGF